MNRPIILLLIACYFTVFAGCEKPNSLGLEDVQGKITVNGAPASLSVIFEPYEESGDLSNTSVMTLKDGSFKMLMQNGLKAGKYRVRFSYRKAFYKNNLKPVPEGTEAHRDEVLLADALPAEFATKESKVQFEAVKGKKNVFNYDIVTDYVPSAESIRAGGRGRR